MKNLIISLATLLSLATAPVAQSSDSDQRCKRLNKKVRALITEYRELRERRRQLPEGTYDKDLRDHGGELHKVLTSLGNELGRPPYNKQTIVECVGEPDAVRNIQQMAPYLELYKRESRRAGR